MFIAKGCLTAPHAKKPNYFMVLMELGGLPEEHFVCQMSLLSQKHFTAVLCILHQCLRQCVSNKNLSYIILVDVAMETSCLIVSGKVKPEIAIQVYNS